MLGIALIVLTGVWTAYRVPAWLVVDQPPRKADIAVVLGGGGGSRLKKGLALYAAGMVDRIVLVDKNKQCWDAMLRRQCPACTSEVGKIVFLSGSINTQTDARLVFEYCRENSITGVLVVTDPYHTRRASLLFNSLFKPSNIQVTVVSSGEFGSRLSPDQHWWLDEPTLRTVWNELGKILFLKIKKL